jgi:hypothetical protein
MCGLGKYGVRPFAVITSILLQPMEIRMELPFLHSQEAVPGTGGFGLTKTATWVKTVPKSEPVA